MSVMTLTSRELSLVVTIRSVSAGPRRCSRTRRVGRRTARGSRRGTTAAPDRETRPGQRLAESCYGCTTVLLLLRVLAAHVAVEAVAANDGTVLRVEDHRLEVRLDAEVNQAVLGGEAARDRVEGARDALPAQPVVLDEP